MSIQIIKGIQLPVFDVEMLNLGKLIAVPFKQYIPDRQAFWLYPVQQIPFGLEIEEYYKAEYINAAKKTLAKYSTEPVVMATWAYSEYHWHIHPSNKHLLPRIAQSTIWTLNALENIFDQFQVLKLLFLRVYRLAEPCIINTPAQPSVYYWASSEDTITSSSEKDLAIVSDFSFTYRKKALMEGTVNPYFSLEKLQLQIEQLDKKSSQTELFLQEIKQFLGWVNNAIHQSSEPDWIKEITLLGNRSMEEDGTTSYQAGTDFEKIVRKSLEFIGFKVDYSHAGGAGGIDLFCSEPYPLVGECKSGKKIPNATAVQLLNLGTIRLNSKEEFSRSAKLIIGPGEPTDQLKKAAKVHGMAILNPAMLEKLVKLHHNYPIDLFKLRDYLVDGRADDEVQRFIDQTRQSVKLRSQIIQLVKSFLESSYDDSADISQIHAIYTYSNPPQPLKREEMQEILIELSSPLLGYLGRKKGNDGSDRFYFLRDLVVD